MRTSMIHEDLILEEEDGGWNLVGARDEFGASSNDWS